jgi:hypothetical protein
MYKGQESSYGVKDKVNLYLWLIKHYDMKKYGGAEL